ncbi:hypothetical protein H4F38_09275 [Pectobacterium brasiliense]|uniref:hypothetical protein n=1 Tax=Pectobacterium brasiliense TaxID=180957 RepID=UPI000B099DCC|nr:hypothetical protein [Pectobacterium brasiliense]MBN3097944.1 hypothetical protein [Pectobacterium brasiliense]MBN3103188.1 hypothetical protein [Pectobacterium brasiliense]MBN3164001.1 hypothetical protein [Pectobacterium brasiliense]MBN3181384.1 hypothetical protein [Pectobacterium brasiliense]WGL28831.1 hypothetical protein OWC53_04405 [Pectobacterium brasiliense]
MLKSIRTILFDILAIFIKLIFSITFIFIGAHLPDTIMLPFVGLGIIFSFWFGDYLADKLR